MTNQTRTEPLDRLAVTRSELVDLLDAHLPRMAFRQYGQTYNDDPDFDVIEYYERVVSAIFEDAAPSLIAEAREAARLRDLTWEYLEAVDAYFDPEHQHTDSRRKTLDDTDHALRAALVKP